LVIALDVVKAAVKSTLPAVELSQIDTCESVSEPDAQLAHDGRVVVIALDPPEAAAQAMTTRVVFALGAVVAAEPGSAVCSLT
jgi:hypothetical protein